MEIKGFEECKSILSFSRYVMEKKDSESNEGVKAFIFGNTTIEKTGYKIEGPTSSEYPVVK